MLYRSFGFKIHDYLQFVGSFVLAFGLPMNKVLMSLGTICLAANLLFKADFKNYWKRWKTNFVFWFVFLLLIMHLVGLLYTENLEYAFGDLRSKLPLFVIPIALIAYPIKKNLFDYVLGAFLLSLVITSIINYSYMVDYSFEDY